MDEPEFVSISGPVIEIDGTLTLSIPLHVGGAALARSARGIGAVEGDFLVVRIPDWLAEKLGITNGSIVDIDNAEGRFNITLHADDDDDESTSP